MSNLFERHPQQALVPYLDGELSARQVSRVDRHLASCAQCRAELDGLKNMLAECVRYQAVTKAQTPEAPQEWRDLYRDFSRIDESLANDSLLVRLMRPLMHSGALRWSFVSGLAVLIVLISLNQLRQAPSVHAASLLRKAVEFSAANQKPLRHIRIRTSRQQDFSRLAGVQGALMQVAQAQVVAAMFQSARFDWNDPLSARAFEQWRDAQPNKTDEVTEVAGQTQIKTVSTDGEIAAATLTLKDYQPLDELLEFRDHEWIELSEISEGDIAGAAPGRHIDIPERAAELPSRPAAFAPRSEASISDELKVLSALSTIEADLGDPVEVSLSEGKVKVTGEGILPRRQSQIRAALADIPHVEVDFRTPPAAAAPSQAVAASATATSTPASPLQPKLEKELGSHAEFERFSTQWLDLDDAAMQRVTALHNLAKKFPADEEARLSPQDLGVLHELTRKHTAVLADKVSGMERILVPTLTGLGGTAASVPIAARSAWQPAADDVFSDFRWVDVLVSQMLGMNASGGSPRALPSDVLSALQQLHASLDECKKLLQSR